MDNGIEVDDGKSIKKNYRIANLLLFLGWLLCVILILVCCNKSEPTVIVENPIDASCSVGDYVTFGRYRQNWFFLKKEPIEWLVLAREDEKALLISRYALTSKPFGNQQKKMTWSLCSLRDWLNDQFFTEAFDKQERMAVLATPIHRRVEEAEKTGTGKAYSYYDEYGKRFVDSDTTDKVFLLSREEAEQYFNTDEERSCKPTAYAIWRGCSVSGYPSSEGNCWWWLRTSGSDYGTATYVVCDGSLTTWSHSVEKEGFGVRPAIWVDLGAIASQ